MSRTERLFDLLQLLRRHRSAVSGPELAAELGISIRTLYRDIVTLQGQGADIHGEAGLGYQLRPGFVLPPLMFTKAEIEAILLGSQWVADRGDGEMRTAARDALAKIAAVLPVDLQDELAESSFIIGPGDWVTTGDQVFLNIRSAIRSQRKLTVTYRDEKETQSKRVIWPLAIAMFDHVRLLVSWCELRGNFRHFRVDRLTCVELTTEPFPRRRHQLLTEWRAKEQGASE